LLRVVIPDRPNPDLERRTGTGEVGGICEGALIDRIKLPKCRHNLKRHRWISKIPSAKSALTRQGRRYRD